MILPQYFKILQDDIKRTQVYILTCNTYSEHESIGLTGSQFIVGGVELKVDVLAGDGDVGVVECLHEHADEDSHKGGVEEDRDYSASQGTVRFLTVISCELLVAKHVATLYPFLQHLFRLYYPKIKTKLIWPTGKIYGIGKLSDLVNMIRRAQDRSDIADAIEKDYHHIEIQMIL